VGTVANFRIRGLAGLQPRGSGASAKRFLLPHERWLVGWFLESQRTHRTAVVVAMEQKYGPRGIVWMDAYFVNLLFVVPFGLAGFISVFATPTYTSQITLYLFAAVLLFLILSFLRVLQASHAGRKFRRESS
jgi:hypothetical protein